MSALVIICDLIDKTEFVWCEIGKWCGVKHMASVTPAAMALQSSTMKAVATEHRQLNMPLLPKNP